LGSGSAGIVGERVEGMADIEGDIGVRESQV
jgi:hypothetical protein